MSNKPARSSSAYVGAPHTTSDSAPRFRIFLSRVSSEFEKAALDVASDLRARGLEVKTQEDFRQETATETTLDLLHLYIRECNAVVALVGNRSGGYPPKAAAQKYKDILPPGVTRASYTQWEVYFARHYQRRLSFYDGRAFTDYSRDPLPEDDPAQQDKYVHWLFEHAGLNRDPFITADQLRIAVLRQNWPPYRRNPVLWIAIVVGLMLIAGVVWMVFNQVENSRKQDKLIQAIQALPTTYETNSPLAGSKDEVLARAYVVLEDKLKLPRGTLAKELPQFAEQLLQRSDTSLMDRANALFAAKRYAEAEDAALEAKDKALATGQSVKDIIAAIELAGIAAEARPEYARALEHYLAAAALTSEHLDAIKWAGVKYCIARLHYKLGRYSEAAGEIMPIIQTYERLVGPTNQLTLYSRNAKAAVLFAQGKYPEAKNEFSTILLIIVRERGSRDPDALAMRNNVAATLHCLCKYTEAEKEYLFVLRMQTSGSGLDPLDILTTRNNLAEARLAQTNLAGAKEQIRAVLASPVSVLPSEHPLRLTARSNQAETLRAEGKLDEAEAEHRAVKAERERVLETWHPDTLKSSYYLALCLQAKGRKQEALEFAWQASTGLQKTLPPTHPDAKSAKKLVEELARTQ